MRTTELKKRRFFLDTTIEKAINIGLSGKFQFLVGGVRTGLNIQVRTIENK